MTFTEGYLHARHWARLSSGCPLPKNTLRQILFYRFSVHFTDKDTEAQANEAISQGHMVKKDTE